MATKEWFGSERAKPDSGIYPANERALQNALSSHPSGMFLRHSSFVEALDRGASAPVFALLLAKHAG